MDQLMPAFAQAPPMRSLLTEYLNQDLASQSIALQWLQQSDFGEIDPAWEPTLRGFLDAGPGSPLFEPTIEILARQKGTRLLGSLDRWIADESVSPLLRVQMLQAKVSQNRSLPEDAFALLMKVLQQEKKPALRMRALDILTNSSLTAERKTQLASISPDFSHSELARILPLYRKIDSPEQAAPLAEAIVRSPGFSRLDPDRLRQLFRPLGGESFEKIQDRIALQETELQNREKKLEQYLAEVPHADPDKGRELYFSGAGSCIVCHRVETRGGLVGPDLSTIGRIRNAKDLLESILYPDASIARDFETIEVFEKGPNTTSRIGILEKNDLHTITLVDAAAQTFRIPRSQIESIVPVPNSLMPTGLDATLQEGQLSDLVAYLLQLRGEASEPSIE